MVSNGTNALLQDTVVIEANQFPIKSVKLFSSGGAEITRTFPLSFLRSQDEPQIVEVVHLPSFLHSVSVSTTSVSGNVTILDHYQISPTHRLSKNSTYSSQTLRELETEELRLKEENRHRLQSFTLLTTYMDSVAQCKAYGQQEPTQMVSFFDDFVELGVTRSSVIAELDAKLANIGDKISAEKERLSKINKDLPVKVVTILACNAQAPVEAAELTLTYVVTQVSWHPAYDLHVAITGDTPSPTVKLEFRCAVTQWTEENWENVGLGLTTADQISQLIQLPEPKMVDISLGPTHVVHSPVVMAALSPRQAIEPQVRLSAPLPYHYYEDLSPNVFPVPETPRTPSSVVDVPSGMIGPTVSQLISHFQGNKDPITHIANGSIFVPSDSAEHHILVASLSLEAEFMRVAVPSIDTRVYYTCEVRNTSEYVLLPGTVKTYLNDKHVSSTEIHGTELPQILECSLAVDTGVKTIHNRAPDALPSVNTFTGRATTTYTNAIVVHNTRSEPIRGVVMRSAIPLPSDPRITIILLEPAGLAEIDEGSVSVKEGCLARWSTTGERKGKQAGLFEWVCDVKPGTEMLKAVWEVRAPQDLKLLEQIRT